MTHKLLIVDDEPLVQIGLKAMLSGDFPDMDVVGTAANGSEGLELIGKLRPDIVIADIKMPRMTGLEMQKESRRLYGPLPVFIILTSYEEFELARQALSAQAVDYLVKIELNKENLREALEKAKARAKEYTSSRKGEETDQRTWEEFRQKFMIRLLNRQIPDEDVFRRQAEDLMLNFGYNRYIAVYGQILGEPGAKAEEDGDEKSRILLLCSSCLNMAREIVERYAVCYTISNDLHHFTLIFPFDSDVAVANAMARIQTSLENVRVMLQKLFNATLRFGIGTAVHDPMEIATSWEEAMSAQQHTTAAAPVLLFSHIAGANRRSGKDKLIASIQDYINENLDGKLLLNEVADVFGLSPAYLSVLFKKSTDIGFSEYIYTRKIEKAKQMLLSGDMKIYEVSDALGFESAFYFSKVFKKVDGRSPREYIQSKTAEVNHGDGSH